MPPFRRAMSTCSSTVSTPSRSGSSSPRFGPLETITPYRFTSSSSLLSILSGAHLGLTARVVDALRDAGIEDITIVRGYKEYQKKAKKAEKMILFQPEEASKVERGSIPYAIDRTKNDLTLQDITRAAINFLMKKQDKKDGFFLMVEGGKIDWGCHANDPVFITELIDMDNAVKVAYEFYQQHPDETLIVITADHETGGLALGKGPYELNLKAVASQRD